MRLLGALGVLVLLLAIGAAAYAFIGFYNVAATRPHIGPVAWSLDATMESSVQYHADQEVRRVPSLDDPQMIRTGARHFAEEGCSSCHGAPGVERAGFANHMRPRPPDLAEAAGDWSDAELYWIMANGIRMTGMPAFGPTHDEQELWAMVAFVRRLPEMSVDQYRELSGAGGDDATDRHRHEHEG